MKVCAFNPTTKLIDIVDSVVESAGASDGNKVVETDASGLIDLSVIPTLPALATKEAVANKGALDGYAPLDSEGFVPFINLPDLSMFYTQAPVAPPGAPTDDGVMGQWAFDANYLYICVQGHSPSPLVTPLWKRIAFDVW